MAMPTLRPLAAHTDAKLRRRALFLLASLAAASPAAAAAIAADADDCWLKALLAGLADKDDEDVRTQSGRLLQALSGGEGSAPSAAAKRLAALGAADACERARARVEAVDAEARDPEERDRIAKLTAMLAKV